MTPTHTDSSDAQFSTHNLDAGDRVVDRDADPDDQNPAIVVGLPEEPAYAHEIDAINATVADVNPDYPASGSVATVAFVNDLDDVKNWRIAASAKLPAICEEWDVQTYTYPIERLRKVSDE